jgi:hypothetical protein
VLIGRGIACGALGAMLDSGVLNAVRAFAC